MRRETSRSTATPQIPAHVDHKLDPACYPVGLRARLGERTGASLVARMLSILTLGLKGHPDRLRHTQVAVSLRQQQLLLREFTLGIAPPLRAVRPGMHRPEVRNTLLTGSSAESCADPSGVVKYGLHSTLGEQARASRELCSKTPPRTWFRPT
jgi:hypothetical protein